MYDWFSSAVRVVTVEFLVREASRAMTISSSPRAERLPVRIPALATVLPATPPEFTSPAAG